jgi:insertion element IS1 protein InsB
VKIEIKLHCPRCQSTSIKKNGIKRDAKQNYRCKACGRQFVGDHNLTYLGCHSKAIKLILLMLVRCCGIRDIAKITRFSIGKILKTLTQSNYEILPKKTHYKCLEIDEFWTFVGDKKNKHWLQYVYDRGSGEIVAFVWGGRDAVTAQRLKTRMEELNITYDCIASDHWESFIKIFKPYLQGKYHTVGIEGNNCRLRHRIKRAVRRTCCFSKKVLNHIKAFNLGFFYINHGFI